MSMRVCQFTPKYIRANTHIHHRIFVWSVPSCSCWACICSSLTNLYQELGEFVHKRTTGLHVFICPKLMIPVQERLLFKMVDLVVYVPPGETFWSSSMHKSFVLGFVFPLIPHRPWRIRGTPKVWGMVRTVYLLIRESTGYSGSVLRQLWFLLKKVASMSGFMEWGLLLR